MIVTQAPRLFAPKPFFNDFFAEPFLASIAEDVKEGTQSTAHAISGDLVAVASNLAFAVKLYIKTLLAQLQHDVPRGHDLGKLFVAIPEHVREEIEKSYNTLEDTLVWQARFHNHRQGQASQPYGKIIATSPRISEHSSLDREMYTSSWRYIYEFTEPNQGNYQLHHFEYGLLISACEAIRAAINDRLQNSLAGPEL